MHTVNARTLGHALAILEARKGRRMPRKMWLAMTCMLRHGKELETTGMIRCTRNEVVLVPEKITEDMRCRMRYHAEVGETFGRQK